MTNRFLVKCAVFASLFAGVLPQTAFGQQTWSMGFLESAQDPTQRALVNWSAVTHIMDFGVSPASDGSLVCDFGSEPCSSSAFTTARADLITKAHSHGVKVLMVVTDANGAGGFTGAASSGTLSTFVANIMSMVNTNGYDGVDLDWEASDYTTRMPALISALRTALGSSRLLAVDAVPGTQSFWAANYSVMDRVNFMTYDQEANWNPYTWFNAALYSDAGDAVWSLDLMKRRALAAGIPANKITLGIPFYGYVSTGGGVTGPRQSTAGNPSLAQTTYRSLLSSYSSQMANPTVDSVSKTPWFGITNGWVEYDNPVSITAKVNYIKANSLGGWILFSLNKDASGNPLAAAVAAAMGGVSAPTISSFTANPATITSGGSSTLSWVTSGATNLSINQGLGTVTGTSVAVSPTATTTYTLTATNSAGSVTRSVTVTVTVNNPPPSISSFTATPPMIGSGGSTTLSWSTTGAASLSINQGVGVVTNTTSRAVSPPATMTYTLTASNASGSISMPATVTVSSAPLAYWKFDDRSGTTAADSSGNGHSMALFNAPEWPTTSSCAVNGCLAFNGTTQYGSSALDLSGTNVITVAFWLKWSSYSNNNKIALEFTPNFNNASTGFLILPNESVSGQFQAGFQGNAGYNQVNFPRPSAGIWHHYAFIMNTSAPAATQVIPYVDGQLISYTKPTNAANTNNFGRDTLFAMSRNGTSLFGSGGLDELRIYPRALSATEILSLAGGSPTITTPSPLIAGTVGLPYSQTLTSSGSTPITWNLTSGALPAGLSLGSSSGVISGTPSTASSYSFIVDATNTAGSDSQQYSLIVNPASAALTYNVSDLNWTNATIGWGTIHKNASVGGNVLTLNGVTYTEGIGTHADSQIVYNLGGSCNTFQSDVGIDDEVGSAGSVAFQVFGDGVKLYDSGLINGSSATKRISVSIAGRSQLGLIVNHGGTNINSDHADWANPRLTCSSAPPAAN